MAKVTLANLSPGATPLTRKAFLLRDTRDGAIAQAWPPPRGAAKTPHQWYMQAEFLYAARMAANPHFLDFGTAVEMVKGTTLVPRDFLMMAAYGKAYIIQQQDGFTWPLYRDMAPNPQYILDLLTNTEGSMIWRRADGWQAIPGAPDNGYVLGWVGNEPQWSNSIGIVGPEGPPGTPGAPGAGANWSLFAHNTSLNGNQYATFTGINASDILVMARNITASSLVNRVMDFSTDNGSTWRNTSGDYKTIAGTGTETNTDHAADSTSVATSAQGIFAEIFGANLNSCPKLIRFQGGTPNRLFVQSNNAVNAIRIGVTSGTMTGGEIYLLTRDA